jgi:uncharacterized protein
MTEPPSEVSAARLRAMALTHTTRGAATVGAAIASMQFVQYDPIRSPARAQDLVLAARVEGYRVGDLDRAYPTLAREEGHLHVYGAMPADVLAFLRPRCDEHGRPVRFAPTALEQDVLAAVRERGELHPTDGRLLLGTARTTNAWGGMSAATTRALEMLHRHGDLRVAFRRNGTKVYAPARVEPLDLPGDERLRRATLLLAGLLAPVHERTLREVLTQLRRHSGGVPKGPTIVADLLRTGELASTLVDGHRYVWPADVGFAIDAADAADGEAGEVAGGDGDGDRVRFLAPFDPLAWDRRRFEQLWGWPYRFEAYTPVEKRRFGYYALPLLWRDDIVGWVNAAATPGGALAVEPGFVHGRPRGKAFTQAFDREVAHLRRVVTVPAPA